MRGIVERLPKCSKYLIVLFLALTAGGLSSTSGAGKTEPSKVSMVALLAAPTHYNGIVVQTTGFLAVEFEGNALYLHEEDYRYGMEKNAVQLALTKPQEQQFKALHAKHVLIEGVVSADNRVVDSGMYSGIIRNITRLQEWPVYGHR